MSVDVSEMENGDLTIREDTRFVQWGIALVVSIHIAAFTWLVKQEAEFEDILQVIGIALFLILAIVLLKRTKQIVFSLGEQSLVYKYFRIFSIGPLVKIYKLDLIQELNVRFSEIDSESKWVTISFNYSGKNTKISFHHSDRKDYDRIMDALRLWLIKNIIQETETADGTAAWFDAIRQDEKIREMDCASS